MNDNREDAWYLRYVGVYCDACGTDECGDIRARSREEAFEGMREHLRKQGWSCDDNGDFCPPCLRKQPHHSATSSEPR